MTTAPRRRSHYDLGIKVLGPLEVFRGDGDRIALSPELRGVLAALALRPRQVVPVEKLTDSIWPGVDDRVARRRLHTAIWKLRKLLGSERDGEDGEIIRRSTPGYVLDVADAQLDWTRFDRLQRAGETALQRGPPGLVKTYLLAALSFWVGPEALVGVDIPADDLGFVAQLGALRARAIKRFVESCFRLGEYHQVVPELERHVAADPLDDELIAQLAVAYYRSGNPSEALSVCRRYLDLADKERIAASSARIVDLQTAILRRDPQVGHSPDGESRTSLAPGSPLGNRAFLSASWAPFTPTPLGPLPAELLLVVEDHGGTVNETTDSSVEASFSEVRPGFEAAIALQQALGEPPLARVGIEVRVSQGTDEVSEGPIWARARLLASAAREGQVLVAGIDDREALQEVLPSGSKLRGLGTHRLNALTPPTSVFQLTAPALPVVRATPRWFDQGPVYNLADDPFRFVGRAKEVEEIARHLQETRLITLTGPPGSGKTRLAGHVAAGICREYRDGVWFVALQSVSEPGLVAVTVAESLRIPRPAAIHLGALIRSLRDKHALVILDNCEHVLAECRDLADGLLPACPGITILATSREALHSRFEHALTVSPLDPPPVGPPETVLDNAAVQLFYDRLPSRGAHAPPRGDHDPREVEAVGRICRVVEGIPLSLVLAAARAHELGEIVLADLLEERLGEGAGLRLLSGAAHSAQEAGVTLEGTLEWSYRLLEKEERLLFDCLSVFRAGFSVNDAVAVCAAPTLLSRDEVITGLERLVQASLVQRGGEGGWFRLLQPVRDFASGKIAARGRRAVTVGRRHAEHFLAVAEGAEPYVRGPQDRATLDRLDAALPDLYAAIRWSIDRGEPSMALRLVGALWVFWLVCGRIIEGHEMVEAALATDPAPSPERTKALVACSQLAWFSGDLARTRECSREVLATAEATGDEWAWAWGPLGLAAVEMFKGEHDGVPLRIEEILPTFRKLGNDWDTGQALQTLGGAAWHRGLYEYAEKALSESLALYKSLGHPTLMASLAAHGLMLSLLGHLDAGAAEVEASIDAAYEAGDLGDLAYALCHRGAIARYRGRHERARRYFRNALTTARDAGSLWAIQWALGALAGTEGLGPRAPMERVERSVELLARAEALSNQTGIILPPREREFHAQDLERARARLGERAFEAALTRGGRLSVDEAIDLALSLEEPEGPVG